METLVSDQYKDDHYHDASEHGLSWALLHELLHVIVFIYTLYGMIQFKVKFIHMAKLVRWLSFVVIFHSWYLTIKFAIIATVMYLFNEELESRSISWSDYNCSLENHVKVFETSTKSSSVTLSSRLNYLTDIFVRVDYPLLYSEFLSKYGGPLKLLGNRSTLMYGFYSIAIYIMLAIFPIELMYLRIGFNYIRFVLSDTSCMKELYENRKRHLDRLASWSRNQNDSELTLGTKIALNQRDLRSRYADDCNHLAVQMVVANMAINNDYLNTNGGDHPSSNAIGHNATTSRDSGMMTKKGSGHKMTRSSSELSRMATVEYKLSARIKPLRSRLAINHMDTPSYSVRIANKNLNKFKPFVRSETWFKFSMVIYPIAIFYYFTFLTIIIGIITITFQLALRDIGKACACQTNNSDVDFLFSNWSNLDLLLYIENHYTVFALSCASSFYCSYYFGTIFELLVWIQEVSQQLDLCKIIIELEDSFGWHKINELQSRTVVGCKNGCANYNRARRCVNEFGGFNCFWSQLKLMRFSSQAEKFKIRELMAIKLLTKKQTLMRATYINMCLFFDELNETRFMTKTILRRTTQIAFGFALVASITRSQFQANYWHLTFLLAACLAILNLYLACAATINGSVNKLLVQVHSLISVSLKTSSDNADLFEFWVRHIRSFGEDRDVMSYKIYGYKITWATILNFDSAVCTAYFYTVY